MQQAIKSVKRGLPRHLLGYGTPLNIAYLPAIRHLVDLQRTCTSPVAVLRNVPITACQAPRERTNCPRWFLLLGNMSGVYTGQPYPDSKLPVGPFSPTASDDTCNTDLDWFIRMQAEIDGGSRDALYDVLDKLQVKRNGLHLGYYVVNLAP